ncbi:lipopolysaccharide transport periplasmic protein LptA [Sulfurospirillum arcachonense]|uniref:lipopolysaccharide transport periplasmic protein LptA n=1 Tax=Sulfurospirillum arcachonense TaxID=57666 RepID=UPI001FE18E0B|nr:lipopolysaccharide transport periplasmic protein LptA [Sulfurospirillum arcachonense]
MKLLITFLSMVAVLNAGTVEVVADKFFADENKQVTEFNGHVIVTKQSDKLVANKVVINFDKKRQPLKYTATGNVKLDMIMNDKVYFGSAEKMIYDPIKDQYTFIKNAYLYEKITNKKVYGNKIFVDQKTGRYEVDSDGKKPVKFIFKVQEKNKK